MAMSKPERKIKTLYAVIIILMILTGLALVANWLFGAGRILNRPLKQGNVVLPDTRNLLPSSDSHLREALLNYWSSMPFPESGEKIKLQTPRIILACFSRRVRTDEANRKLMTLMPHGVTGSHWALNPGGDYDFTLLGLTPILFMFGDNDTILYPAARDHLLNVLLTADGDHFDISVPHTLGLIEDTENHVLMTQGSRYLKNRWLRLHGNEDPRFNNLTNGMEEKLAHYLDAILKEGIYEFNSNPYQGYTLSALLSLNAFGSKKIRDLSRAILDRVNWQYALGSFDFKRFPPMRRRYNHASDTIMDRDYQGIMMRVWESFYHDSLNLQVTHGEHMAIWAALMPYRPPDSVLRMVLKKPFPYFVKIGHNRNSCPEIYSGDADYLLSAGGVNQGKHSLIVARPVILFCDTSVRILSGVFHTSGPGDDFMKWNNTGVYKYFACAAGPVHVPSSYTPLAGNGDWKIFRISDHHLLAVFSSGNLGVLVVSAQQDANILLKRILDLNPVPGDLKTIFHHPDGDIIEYDVMAPRDKWVIRKINGKEAGRDFYDWPFFEGCMNCTDENK